MQNGQEAEFGPDFFDSCLSFCDNSSVLLCQDPLDRKVTKCKGTNTGRDRSLYQCPARQCLLGWTLTQDSSAPAAEQTEKAFQENPIACLLCQQLPPAQAEPLEPRDVPASAQGLPAAPAQACCCWPSPGRVPCSEELQPVHSPNFSTQAFQGKLCLSCRKQLPALRS